MRQSNTVGHLGEMLSPRIRAARKRACGSNVGRYPHGKTLAGPSGGSPDGSYPINTLARAKSALKLAHNAPDPEGIRRAVFRKYPQLRPAAASA